MINAGSFAGIVDLRPALVTANVGRKPGVNAGRLNFKCRSLQLTRQDRRYLNMIGWSVDICAIRNWNAVSKVGGKKELSGKNDLETEISNQCGRLISNAIVYYNSAILSRLLERLEAEGNAKGIEALTRISPVAWQHILLNGHYTFHSSNEIMDLDVLVSELKLG